MQPQFSTNQLKRTLFQTFRCVWLLFLCNRQQNSNWISKHTLWRHSAVGYHSSGFRTTSQMSMTWNCFCLLIWNRNNRRFSSLPVLLCINACYINCKKMVIPVWSRVVTSNRYNSVEHPITTRKPRLKQARPFAPTTLTWQRYSWQWSWQERTWGQDLAQTVCRFCWPRALGGLSCADSRPPSGWGRGRMCPHVSHRAEDDMWSCSTRSNRLYSVI